ncbi:serine/threonine-protein kinase [Mycolicibacterium fortuitum]|uniref:non-specific serine/threonine protein kinase n=1 Tax=Mycolicibacterium fortuitum subsp. fortuitum DSM 46621 = ATCC 6841 = JCM 6387 TaxID=1214102 RepID=K0V1K9_MYCFO|nr:serine/threonine-protein kinase [Mycolicibacterium fortuitum]AIY46693.1 Serine/threonine protein kinase [Mycobacterium sp. VKM Ac-1817D]CRL79510.1 membrane-anchored serine/threonine-protein kinase [Mycolicibacter nonchromogenicus]EJZ08778.1 membrane-anchored serine/threonine-protein kinase [Mycolicibacterium fortuitum subsp. fortuitum DSM 46621 = ATCC 6841 = JCM 6387]WEV30139.1 serine/threonine protein kinase [Mycolicibacterium fortuitum]CRL55931.1 membrane-anchored serine/threonine-protein
MPFNAGDVFAGYTIQRLLGAGGMGEVYLAQHPRLPRLDALKILSVSTTRDDEFRARFNREAELAASLWHPHIVGVHDRGEFDGRLWISMDYVEGTDAKHLIEQHPSGMPLQDVVEIVTAVAEALDVAHERNLLHRDVKPANILVTTPSGSARRRILLTDFGIAREADDADGLTETDVAIGTVAYVAPEQLTGKTLDGRADQYALAATAFHLLTGSPVFEDTNRIVQAGNHLYAPPPRLSERRRDLAHLDAVMAKALAKRPDKRYARCLDFARALGGSTEVSTAPQPVTPDTAPLEMPDVQERSSSPDTKRLAMLTILGTARDVTKTPSGPDSDEEVWTFRVERYESTGEAHTAVPVELRGNSITGELSDGDVVEVSGPWDDRTLFADSVVNHSAGTRRRRRRDTFEVRSGARRRASRSRRLRIVLVLAVVAMIVATSVLLIRGLGSSPHSGGPGPIVTPESATVFSPGGSPDHPDQASLAIDGKADTSWPTDIYQDAAPFPAFKQGVGLMLRLPSPTALSEVTIDVPSTGTEVQIRAADSAQPNSLSGTTELTPNVALQPGENTITVDNRTETSNVLVWISKLGTLDGQSRTNISEITLRAVAD